MLTEKGCPVYRKPKSLYMSEGIGYCDLDCHCSGCEGDLRYCGNKEGLKNYLNEQRRKQGGTAPEKRRVARLDVDLPLEYESELDSVNSGAITINLSPKGLLIRCIKDMPVKTKLKVKVLYPEEFSFNNFEAMAEIVWKGKHLEGEWSGYQYGLRFTQIREEDLQKLMIVLMGIPLGNDDSTKIFD